MALTSERFLLKACYIRIEAFMAWRETIPTFLLVLICGGTTPTVVLHGSFT